MIVFERKYPVNVFDTDMTGKLSTGGLFNYFQDLAGRHATILGFGREHLITNGFFWVLSRIRVEINALPETWQDVTIKTWPRGTEAIFALRDLEMYGEDGVRMAGAATSWVIVDNESRKVQRPDRALSFMNSSFPEERALKTNAGKVAPLPHMAELALVRDTEPDDIDVNMHVNNARYIHWVTNSYNPEFTGSHYPGIIEVNYLSEGKLGDRIKIFSARDEQSEGTFFHSLVREADNCELCRMRFEWRENR